MTGNFIAYTRVCCVVIWNEANALKSEKYNTLFRRIETSLVNFCVYIFYLLLLFRCLYMRNSKRQLSLLSVWQTAMKLHTQFHSTIWMKKENKNHLNEISVGDSSVRAYGMSIRRGRKWIASIAFASTFIVYKVLCIHMLNTFSWSAEYFGCYLNVCTHVWALP